MNAKIKNIIPYLVMCALLTGLAIWSKKNQQDSAALLVRELEMELPSLVPDSEDALLIDVRTQAEYKAGHLREAHNIPRDRISHEIPFIAPDKNQPIILYCRNGKRAGLVKEELEESGYTQVFNLNQLLNKKLEEKKHKQREKGKTGS